MSSVLTILKGFFDFLNALKGLWTFYKASKDEAWFQQSMPVFKEVQGAKTPEERKNAIAKLARLWGSV